MSHATNYGGGQASDQATSGGQAGTGSDRRTDRREGHPRNTKGQCI